MTDEKDEKMFGLVTFPAGNDITGPTALMQWADSYGLEVKYAEDILELIGHAGGEVINPEKYEEYNDARKSNKARYASMRQALVNAKQCIEANGLEAAKARDVVKAEALVDMAEALTVISGINY